MALLWLDGFDTYSVLADMLLRYPGSNSGLCSLTTTGGRFGGGGMANVTNPSNLGGSYMGPSVIPHTVTAIIAGGSHSPSTSSTAYACLCFANTLGNSGTNELALYYDNGSFKLYRGNGVTLLATATGSYPAGVYHHIEAKAVIHDTTGSCEVRINGVTAINISSADTRASNTGTAGVDRVGFCCNSSSAGGGLWDDIYVMDTSGSVANNFLGDCRINTLAPTSDSAVQFTKSTGASNFSCVDEGRMNSDTDYVESATVGHIDKYGYSDLAAGATTVHGLQIVTWARKTDAATRTMKNKLYSNATTTDGSTYPLLTSYAPYVTVATLNPDGSVQWTPTTVNAALAGFEVVS